MCCLPRCQNVTTDQSGKVGFYVPLNLPKDIILLSLKVNDLLPFKILLQAMSQYSEFSLLHSCLNRLPYFLFVQAKSLGIGSDDKSGMIQPKSSHEVKILHNNKTLGLDLLEIDSKTELPCNQVNMTCLGTK